MANAYCNPRIDHPGQLGNAELGRVVVDATKFLWLLLMLIGTAAAVWVATVGAILVFLLFTGLTLCLGHSIGMHRRFIHRSFGCPRWLEYGLVHLGTLVGLAGPLGMLRTHDTRDWAQRRPECHDFLSHQRDILTDFWWQLHCKLHLDNPPTFQFPEKLTTSRFYRFIQTTSMAQQLPLAVLLYVLGGPGWVAWGICGRVTISIFGHWLVGYFAHNQGHRDWHVEGASVQGHNVRHLGLITFGECWHNNHHAFPGSAKLGLNSDQLDPGWLVLNVLKWAGLVRELRQPSDMAARPELRRFKEVEEADASMIGQVS